MVRTDLISDNATEANDNGPWTENNVRYAWIRGRLDTPKVATS